MNSRKKNLSYIVIFLSIILVAGGIFTMRYLIGQKKAPKSKTPEQKIKRIKTTEFYSESSTENKIEAYGRVKAVNKIDIASEVSGKLLIYAKACMACVSTELRTSMRESIN